MEVLYVIINILIFNFCFLFNNFLIGCTPLHINSSISTNKPKDIQFKIRLFFFKVTLFSFLLFFIVGTSSFLSFLCCFFLFVLIFLCISMGNVLVIWDLWGFRGSIRVIFPKGVTCRSRYRRAKRGLLMFVIFLVDRW